MEMRHVLLVVVVKFAAVAVGVVREEGEAEVVSMVVVVTVVSLYA